MILNDSPTTLNVVPIARGPADRWRLSDPYVEEVWSEFLGPTATLVARRVGRVIEAHPNGIQIDLDDFRDSLGVARSLTFRAFRRLHRFKVVLSDMDRGLVGVSGFAPSVRSDLVPHLSESGRELHESLVATSPIEARRPGRASAMLMPRVNQPSQPTPSMARGLG